MTNDEQDLNYTLSEIEEEWFKVANSFDHNGFKDQISYETALVNEFKKIVGEEAFSNFVDFIDNAMGLDDEDLKNYRQSFLNCSEKIF
jgi:hypothetical protein